MQITGAIYKTAISLLRIHKPHIHQILAGDESKRVKIFDTHVGTPSQA